MRAIGSTLGRRGGGFEPGQRRRRPPVIDIAGPALPRPDRDPADREFLPPAVEIVEAPPAPGRTLTGYTICALVAGGLAWSWFGHLPMLAVAPGQLVAAGQAKVIEPRQAGQVVSIPVQDGTLVKKGQVLVVLDPTSAVATQTIVTQKLVSARAELARLRAEIAAARANPVNRSQSVAWDRDIPAVIRQREDGILRADLDRLAATLADLSAQRRHKLSERDKFAKSVAAEKALIAILAQHVAMHRELERQGVESRLKLLLSLDKLDRDQTKLATLNGGLGAAEAAIPVIDAEIAKTRADFVAAATEQLAADDRQAGELREDLKKASQTVTEMTLRAPIAGTVEASAVTTKGQTVQPGQQLMQVVPNAAPLEVEAYVLNTDIGFVHKGQPVTIKVDSFPYSRYGTIPGTVVKVGRDAISGNAALLQEKNGSQPVSRGELSDTGAAEPTSDLVFPVTVRPAKTQIDVNGKPVRLSPGMSVVAEIKTGEQRAIDYILFPLVRGTETPGAR